MRHPRINRFRYFSIRTTTTILERDNHTCVYCGKPATLIDHVVAYTNGGKTTISNGVSCCKSCNKLKESDLAGKYLAKGMTYITRINLEQSSETHRSSQQGSPDKSM